MRSEEETGASPVRQSSTKQLMVTNLRHDTQKLFPLCITLGNLIESITTLKLSKQENFRIQHESQVLDNWNEQLSVLIPESQSPTVQCVGSISINIFSKRSPTKSSFVVWVNQSVEDLLQTLKSDLQMTQMLDAVVVETGIHLGSSQGLAVEFLEHNWDLEIIEDVIELSVTVKSPVYGKAKKTLFILCNQKVEAILNELHLSQALVLHEGRFAANSFYGKYEHKTSGKEVFLGERGHCLNAAGQYKKAMKILVDVPRKAEMVVPVVYVIAGLKFHILDEYFLPKKDEITQEEFLRYGALMYGFVKKKNIFYFRVDNGYLTLYDKNYFHNEAQLKSLATYPVEPFLLMLEDREMVSDELTAKPCNNCQKVKVWVHYGDIWIQRLIPFKSCRQFIPK